MKVNLDPKIIHKMYWEEKKSLPEIGKIFSTYPEKIRRLIMKHNIPLRNRLEGIFLRKKLNVSRKELHYLYWEKGMKLKDIAKLYNVSHQTVLQAFKKFRIPRRNYSEARAIQRRKVSVKELKYLYLERKMPLNKLARYIGTRTATAKILQEAGIPVRNQSESQMKYPRQPFSGDEIERAYLLGFRVGDLSVREDSNTTVASITSTHPRTIKLLHNLFDRYAHYIESPHKNKSEYEWGVSYYLHPSFEFLLNKNEIDVPTQPDLFLSFLAGYADAEGYWKITRKKKVFIELRFDIETQDKKILSQIKTMLEKFGFIPKLYLVKKKGKRFHVVRKGKRIGTFTLKKDMYRLSLCRRNEVIRLAKILLPFTKHSEKRRKIKILLEAQNKKRYEEIGKKVERFRVDIEKEVSKFIEEAKMAYLKRKGVIK